MSQVLESSDRPLQVERARWWYAIALVPVANLVAIPFVALFLLLWFFLQAGVWAVLFGLSLVVFGGAAFLLNAALPAALYKDAQVVAAAGDAVDWDPDVERFVGAGAVGVVVPLVAPAVAAYWLYLRHDRVGVP